MDSIFLVTCLSFAPPPPPLPLLYPSPPPSHAKKIMPCYHWEHNHMKRLYLFTLQQGQPRAIYCRSAAECLNKLTGNDNLADSSFVMQDRHWQIFFLLYPRIESATGISFLQMADSAKLTKSVRNRIDHYFFLKGKGVNWKYPYWTHSK